MRFTFKNTVIFPLTLLIALFSLWVIILVISPTAFHCRARPAATVPEPVVRTTTVSASETDTMAARNLKTTAAALIEAQKVVGHVGRLLGHISYPCNPMEDRRQWIEEVLREFDQPERHTIEYFPTHRAPDVKMAKPVRQYFEDFLKQQDVYYDVEWYIDSVASRVTYQHGIPRCEVIIRQRFTHYAIRSNCRGARLKYQDFTIKTVFLGVKRSKYCEDETDKSQTYDLGCYTFKIGDIKAIEVQAPVQL